MRSRNRWDGPWRVLPGLVPAVWLIVAGHRVVAPVAGLPDPNVKTNLPPHVEPVQPVLSLVAARRIAFERNWDLLAARSDVDLATAQRLVAREFPNPSLSLATEKITVDRGSGTAQGNGFWDRSYDTMVAINQLFEVGGKRSSRQDSARAGFEAAGARFQDAHRVLDLAVNKAYLTALFAAERVQILRESAASLRREATIADVRLKAGDISEADKNQIEILADRLELDAQAAESDAATARITVEVLMGLPDPSGHWTPGDSLAELASLPFIQLAGAPGVSRPDLVAAEAVQRKAEADLRLQRAMRIPDPTVMLMAEHEPPEAPYTVGIGVSLPVPLWNRNRGAIQAATVAKQQAALAVEKLRAQIAAEIHAASLTYADASARLRRQRDQIQPKSAQIKTTVSLAYQRGGASLLDLLTAERNDNDIRLATAQALADAAAAASTLRAAMNVSLAPTDAAPQHQ